MRNGVCCVLLLVRQLSELYWGWLEERAAGEGLCIQDDFGILSSFLLLLGIILGKYEHKLDMFYLDFDSCLY